MGNAEVQYKARRGANAEGDIITDPKDWFDALKTDKYGELKARYDSLSDDKKNEFKQIFEGADVMGSVSNFELWINDMEDVPDELAQAKTRVEAFMATN